MKQNKINITFSGFTPHQFSVAAIIRKCVEATLQAENVCIPCEINVLVTNDKEIRSVNLASRGIDKATDVLSFPMFSFEPGKQPESWEGYIDPETGMCPLGDMAISLQRAVVQAREFGHTTRREIGYLTIHSVLHLLGYDHMDDGAQKAQMRQREEYIAGQIPRMQRG